MIALVLPEPADWVETVIAAASRVGPVRIFAPWALGARPSSLLPEKVERFAARRRLLGARAVPGWVLGEAALAVWSRGQTDRQLAAGFAKRRWTAMLAARWMPDDAQVVIAPSLAAREPFSRARRAVHLLIEELPALRELHLDLDHAATAHPAQGFLRRFRAPAETVARQEAERVLAHAFVVRDRSALARAEAAGKVGLPLPRRVEPGSVESEANPEEGRVLLAGLAAARNGALEALALLEALPQLTLRVRGGEGAARALLAHPRVQVSTAAERERLEGISVVIAPAWCEAHAPEVERAARAGIPVVATQRAAGFVDLSRAGEEVTPGDVEGLVSAVRRWLGRRLPPAPPPPDPVAALAQALQALKSERTAVR